MTKIIEIKCCNECGFNEGFEDEYCQVHRNDDFDTNYSYPLIDLTEIDCLNEIHPNCPLPDKEEK